MPGPDQGLDPYTVFIDKYTRFIPVTLVLFFCIMSIFNRDLKAIPFMIGLYFLHVLLRYFTDTMTLNFSSDSSPMQDDSGDCYIYGTIEQPKAISHGIIGYIFTYVFLPMLYNENYNIFLLALLFILFLIDVAKRLYVDNCYGKNYSDGLVVIIIATMLGASIAASVFFILKYYDDPMIDNLLYYNVSQYNKVQCLRNSEVQYKCQSSTTS